MLRARAVDHKNIILKDLVQFYHVEIPAKQKDEFTSAIIRDRLLKAGGANYDPKQNQSQEN